MKSEAYDRSSSLCILHVIKSVSKIQEKNPFLFLEKNVVSAFL